MKVTELEKKMMVVIAKDEYNVTNGNPKKANVKEDLSTWTDVNEWAESLGITSQQAKGVIGSLCAKDFLICLIDKKWNENTTYFTEEGFKIVMEIINNQ